MREVTEKALDVVALGELLVDFPSHGLSEQGNSLYEACPGGAPCNVLSMLSKLGRRTAFIGKVGDDGFGRMLVKTVKSVGIDASGIVFDKDVRTTLAFVNTDEHGERSFSFYRSPGADMMLSEKEVERSLVRGCRVFHFGTLSSTDEPSRTATRAAVKEARAAGALISFDPNLRKRLWKSEEEAKAEMEWGCEHCDILKISDDEAEFLFGETDAVVAAAVIKRKFPDIKLLFITCGARGSYGFYKDLVAFEKAFLTDKTVDTTGAGDTFCGCCLDAVLKYGIDGLDEEKLSETLAFANAAASIVTTRKGALLAMPEREETERLIK